MDVSRAREIVGSGMPVANALDEIEDELNRLDPERTAKVPGQMWPDPWLEAMHTAEAVLTLVLYATPVLRALAGEAAGEEG